MPVAIKGTGGGSVTLSAGSAAADTTLTLPNTTGTVIYSDVSGNVTVGGTLSVASRGITKGSMPAGSILQVIQTAKTSTSAVSGTANTFQEIDTAFRVTIQPSTSSNKILLSASVSAGQNSGTVRYKIQYSTNSGSTWTDVSPLADAVSSHGQAHFGFPGVTDTNQVTTASIEILQSPATTNSIVYRVLFGGDLTQTYYFNRSINYPDSFLGTGYISTITAKEVAV